MVLVEEPDPVLPPVTVTPPLVVVVVEPELPELLLPPVLWLPALVPFRAACTSGLLKNCCWEIDRFDPVPAAALVLPPVSDPAASKAAPPSATPPPTRAQVGMPNIPPETAAGAGTLGAIAIWLLGTAVVTDDGCMPPNVE